MMLVVPAQGGAAQTIGSDLSGTLLNTSCGDVAQVCTETSRETPTFGDAPFDGVITSWTTRQTEPAAPEPMTLRVLRLVSGTTFVGIRSAPPDLFPVGALGAPVTFPTRLPIAAGDRIGYDHSAALHSCGSLPDSASLARWNPALADGEERQATTLPGDGCDSQVQAVIEPDADRDGYGDESQDQCPTNAGTQGVCPLAALAPGLTGQRAAALRRCKKKAEKKDWSKTKLRKCKRTARLLPI
jgi:hypothetical protein